MSIRSIVKKLSDSRWDIGVITTPLDDILSGADIVVNWIKHNYKDSWFADPFIIDANDNELTLLVEEFYKPIYCGRIAKLVVNRATMAVVKKDVVLELETHLSFPAYYLEQGKIFIYPENGEAGELSLYKYDIANNKCEKMHTICNRPVEDAVITCAFGKKELFATSRPNPNGNVLEIYSWDETSNRFIQSTSLKFEENVARMAGLFFKHKGVIYRPTQECNTQYGHAVTLQAVYPKEGGKYGFKEVRRLYSVHPKFKTGMHTFNVYADGLIATDALTFDNMWLRKILKTLHILPNR